MAHNTNPMLVVSTSITIRLEIVDLRCVSITCCNILYMVGSNSREIEHALTKHFLTLGLELVLVASYWHSRLR
jgi:hypothetical protein